MKSTDTYLCRDPNLSSELNEFIGKHFYHAEERFTEASLLANESGCCVFCVINKTTRTVLRFIYKNIVDSENAVKYLSLAEGEQAVFIRV